MAAISTASNWRIGLAAPSTESRTAMISPTLANSTQLCCGWLAVAFCHRAPSNAVAGKYVLRSRNDVILSADGLPVLVRHSPDELHGVHRAQCGGLEVAPQLFVGFHLSIVVEVAGIAVL